MALKEYKPGPLMFAISGGQPPFTFTGTIYDVVIDVSGELIDDTEAQAKMILARQ
ncbi:MAG: hypothetical protein ABI431_06785 [Candidatus Tumulicola sp.]